MISKSAQSKLRIIISSTTFTLDRMCVKLELFIKLILNVIYLLSFYIIFNIMMYKSSVYLSVIKNPIPFVQIFAIRSTVY
jgi:hypothetical protein